MTGFGLGSRESFPAKETDFFSHHHDALYFHALYIPLWHRAWVMRLLYLLYNHKYIGVTYSYFNEGVIHFLCLHKTSSRNNVLICTFHIVTEIFPQIQSLVLLIDLCYYLSTSKRNNSWKYTAAGFDDPLNQLSALSICKQHWQSRDCHTLCQF